MAFDLDKKIDEIRMAATGVRSIDNDLSPAKLLALAWIKQVQHDWASLYTASDENAGDLAVYQRARELAGEDADYISYASLSAPIYARVPLGPGQYEWPPERHATVIQSMMGGARPVWTHHIARAREQIELEAKQEAAMTAAMRGTR